MLVDECWSIISTYKKETERSPTAVQTAVSSCVLQSCPDFPRIAQNSNVLHFFLPFLLGEGQGEGEGENEDIMKHIQDTSSNMGFCLSKVFLTSTLHSHASTKFLLGQLFFLPFFLSFLTFAKGRHKHSK